MQNSINDIVKFKHEGLVLFGTIVELCEDHVLVEDDFRWKYHVKWEDIFEADEYEHDCYKNRITGMIEDLKDVVYNNARTIISAHQGNFESVVVDIIETITDQYKREVSLYENMKEEDLLIGIAESEGAVRALKTVLNILKDFNYPELNELLKDI